MTKTIDNLRSAAGITLFCAAIVSSAAHTAAEANDDSAGAQTLPQWSSDQFSRAEQSYKPCAACHLDNAQGVPGAFPPLAGRIAGISSSLVGRTYLISVVDKGLSGQIRVGDSLFAGYMQAFGSTMSDQQISDVLNYLALKFPPEADAAFQLFTADEVKEVRSTNQASSTHELRSSIPNLGD